MREVSAKQLIPPLELQERSLHTILLENAHYLDIATSRNEEYFPLESDLSYVTQTRAALRNLQDNPTPYLYSNPDYTTALEGIARAAKTTLQYAILDANKDKLELADTVMQRNCDIVRIIDYASVHPENGVRTAGESLGRVYQNSKDTLDRILTEQLELV